MHRPGHLPGLVAFYGPSGWGKTFAASFSANRRRAYYVEARSSWTRKALLVSILREMGIAPAKTLYEMSDQITQQLALSGRPLIIDEFDHIVERGLVELVRDLYEASGAAVLIIGEEMLPHKLRRWERFHNRVLEWVPAQPADLEDARALARLYAPQVSISEPLLGRIIDVSRGAVRRVCVNLERVRQFALGQGWEECDLDLWGSRELYTGDAPARRVQ